MGNEKAICQLCGEPMPDGEEMFNYHGYSGPCPKPPLQDEPLGKLTTTEDERVKAFDAIAAQIPYEHAHRVEICIRALRALAKNDDATLVRRVRDPNDIAFWQQVALTYERTTMEAERVTSTGANDGR